MKTKVTIVILTIAFSVTIQLRGQDTIDYKTVFPSGISIRYGQGLYSVKDEYISEEKYSGTLPYYNISAEAKQFAFNQDFFYPVGSFSLFSKNIYVFLGPSLQYFYYDINYNFVNPGTFIIPKSFGNMGSLGINADFIYQINTKLTIDGFLRSNLISVSGKIIDEEVHHESSPGFLTVFTATKFDFDFFIRYYLVYRISISMGYKFDLSRINKWDPYIAASDNVIISLNYKF